MTKQFKNGKLTQTKKKLCAKEYTMGERQSLQQLVLGKLDSYM